MQDEIKCIVKKLHAEMRGVRLCERASKESRTSAGLDNAHD